MKKTVFHPDAQTEMTEAAIYYESLQQNLGKRFLASVKDSIHRVQINPVLYPVIELDVRRCLVRPFPFGVMYRDMPGKIIVVAVMHLHREPGYWKDRKN
ncbi:MAG: hypothetical protein P9L94_13040 [Candidatus Hinthialibacter antarcticus]|nr:hypothetical protein [Candidatus Hinthialibacter antarcticus]